MFNAMPDKYRHVLSKLRAALREAYEAGALDELVGYCKTGEEINEVIDALDYVTAEPDTPLHVESEPHDTLTCSLCKLSKPRATGQRMTFTVLAEVKASALFAGENINWKYCVERAAFVHRDKDACEFILHIGDGPGSENYADDILVEMKAYGCTPAFIDAYAEARDAGALRVLFHA